MNVSIERARVGIAMATGLVCVLLCGGARFAQTVYTLHIEAQPLDAALQAFARQTGMQILFFSDLAEGRRSMALDGKYTLDAAMSVLLSDSMLTYRSINARTIEIVPQRAGRAGGSDERRWR